MIAVSAQPARYGSRALAKTNAVITLLKGPTPQDATRHRYWLACFGNPSHYHR